MLWPRRKAARNSASTTSLTDKRSWPVPANFLPSAAEDIRILPELILIIAGVLVMLLEGMRDENEPSTIIPALTLIAIIAAIAGSFIAYANPGTAFQQMLII